jgi:hypothetical protein
MNMKEVLGLIMGGGQGSRLYPLTKLRAKPAVPLAGKYRLIDIPISNCLDAGIDKIAILTQYNSVEIDNRIYPLRDTPFQTVVAQDPCALTAAEHHVVARLKLAFLNSEKLQWHARFLFAKGSIYKTYNGNLLYHGCIPMNDDGSLNHCSLTMRNLLERC